MAKKQMNVNVVPAELYVAHEAPEIVQGPVTVVPVPFDGPAQVTGKPVIVRKAPAETVMSLQGAADRLLEYVQANKALLIGVTKVHVGPNLNEVRFTFPDLDD